MTYGGVLRGRAETEADAIALWLFQRSTKSGKRSSRLLGEERIEYSLQSSVTKYEFSTSAVPGRGL